MRRHVLVLLFVAAALLGMVGVAEARVAVYGASSGFGYDTGIDMAVGDRVTAKVSPDFNICGGFDGTSSGFCFTGRIAAWSNATERDQFEIKEPYDGGAWYRIGSGPWTRFTPSTSDVGISTAVTATTAGRLHVTTNDRASGWADNRGTIRVNVRPASEDPDLVGHWDFASSSETTDNWGNLSLTGNASLGSGELAVTSAGHARAGTYNGPTLTDKTLVAWVRLDNRLALAGSPLSLRANNDNFDAIVYNENQNGRWMAGSDFFRRTQNFVPGIDDFATGAGTLRQVAISYRATSGGAQVITGCLDGQPLGSYTATNTQPFGSANAPEALFGPRHGTAGGPVGALNAHIDEARLFKRAIGCDQALATAPSPLPTPSVVTAPGNINPAYLGSTLTNSGKFTNPGGGALTMTASLGSVVAQPDGSFTWQYTPLDPATAAPVTITATNAQGRSASTTFTITIPTPTMTTPSCVVRGADGKIAPFDIGWTNLYINNFGPRESFWLGAERVPGRTAGDILAGGRLAIYGRSLSHATTWGGRLEHHYSTVPASQTTMYVNVRRAYQWDPVLLEKAVPICTDTTPPTVAPTTSGTVGLDGWFLSNVSLAWLVNDPESAETTSGCGPQLVTVDTTGTSFTCSATSPGGTTTSSTTIKRDATPPLLSVPSAPVVVEAGSADGAIATFTTSASDATSQLASKSCTPDSGSVFGLGTTWVTCVATDNAGLTTTRSFSVNVVDTTAPAFDTPADVTAEATGPSGAEVEYDAPASGDAVDGPGTASCSPASKSTFALGTTKVTCSATDTAGNTSSGAFHVTVSDTTAPVVTVPADITEEATSADGAKVDLAAATAQDAVDGAVATTCDRSSGDTFALGETHVNCAATDAAGNEGSATYRVAVVDTTGPVLDLPADRTVEATSASGASADFTASAADAVSGDTPVSCAAESGATFPLGETTVACSSSDARDNTSTGSFKVTVVDTTAPALDLPSDRTAEATGPGGAAVDYEAAGEDLVDGAIAATCSPASGATFALGTTTVDCAASDARGNRATGSFEVTVEDTTAPEFDAPEDVTGEAAGPSGAAVSYETPKTTDAVDGAGDAVCSPASGSTFPLGETKVTCTAKDAAGNASERSFDVTVSDTTKPVLALPDDRTAEATGASGAAVSYTASAHDAVDGAVPVSCSPASGATFALGTTTVDCSASDSSGHEATGSFSVRVVDTTAPAITGASDQVVEATGPNGAEASFSPSASDAVDGATPVACSPASGATFPLGETEVTCTAEDAAGNTSSRSFSVDVRDTTAPEVTLPADFVVDAVDAAGASVSITGRATDAVDRTLRLVCSRSSAPGTFGVPISLKLAIGTHTIRCSAADDAGNVGTESLVVTVRSPAQQAARLKALLASFGLDPATAAPIVAKVDKLIESIPLSAKTGQPIGSQTRSLSNQIKAKTGTQPGKLLTTEQADQLLALLKNIETILDAPKVK